MTDPLAACRNALIVVAHPDDEVLWAGGTIVEHSTIEWLIVALCRESDTDRNPKFYRVARELKGIGIIGDLDDGPEQLPLDDEVVEDAVLALIPRRRFDLVLTHGPRGEYTRHRRHEEVSRAVCNLWRDGRLAAKSLWLFAYGDENATRSPRAIASAHERVQLDRQVRGEKYRLITEVYGFLPDSFEARAVADIEAFWTFTSPADLDAWIKEGGHLS